MTELSPPVARQRPDSRPGFASFADEPASTALVDADGKPDYTALRDTPDFTELRRRTMRFTVPALAFFLLWYLTFVLLSAYFPDLMATPVLGAVNIGIVFGLLQFVSTVGIATLYWRYARREIDPRVDAVRALTEVDTR